MSRLNETACRLRVGQVRNAAHEKCDERGCRGGCFRVFREHSLSCMEFDVAIRSACGIGRRGDAADSCSGVLPVSDFQSPILRSRLPAARVPFRRRRHSAVQEFQLPKAAPWRFRSTTKGPKITPENLARG